MLQKYKKLIITIVIIILAFFVYSQFFGGAATQSTSLLKTTQAVNSTDILGADIIKAINQINSLKLDRSIFDDPILRNLIDRSEEINPQPKGRRNPFAPIGIGGTTQTSTTTSPTVGQ